VEGETVPDHSTLSVTRQRLPLEVHHAVFGFIRKPQTKAPFPQVC
jgi:hypothetical protein